jgi:hypothetical protein
MPYRSKGYDRLRKGSGNRDQGFEELGGGLFFRYIFESQILFFMTKDFFRAQ